MSYHLDRFPEVALFITSLDAETDRGCALMCAAFLDDVLKQLLLAAFVDERECVKLLEHHGPLDSFANRIDVAFAMGLLPQNAKRDLHLIRKMRNEFGHVAAPLSFQEPSIASRCNELSHSLRESSASSKQKFRNAAAGLCAVLFSQISAIARPTIPVGVTQAMFDEAKAILPEVACQFREAFLEAGDKDAKEEVVPSVVEKA